jgi:thiamine-phosphate pyrophosphorylase
LIRYLITDGSAAMDEARWLQHLAAHLERGVDMVQIRERDLSARRLSEITRKVLRLPNPRGAKILINDRADIALACGADGVHLRDGSVVPGLFRGRGLIISTACHNPVEVGRACGADYILLGPVFAPLSKVSGMAPLGLNAITQAAGLTSIPILALGGVTESNAHLCFEAGAAGVAGISLFAG